MGRFGPETLRVFVDAVEDGRRMENVEGCRYLPALNQNMLLALNGAMKEGCVLPDAGIVVEWLKERVISVTSPDGQSVVLGLFYTNRDPFNRKMAKLAVGIFPLHAGQVNYLIRPDVDLGFWESKGQIRLTDESASGGDPFLILNPNGPDLLFFKRCPFGEEQPYKAVLHNPCGGRPMCLPEPGLHEDALERCVIERALWYVNTARRRPYLFLQAGFRYFMRENRFDPRYRELYQALAKSRFRDSYSSLFVF